MTTTSSIGPSLNTPSPTQVIPPTQESSESGNQDPNKDKSDDQKSNKGKVSGGAIAGIIIGLLVAAGICVLVAVIYFRRKSQEKSETEATFMNLV